MSDGIMRLHRPVAGGPFDRRLHAFAGRHLGEDEFDRIQRGRRGRVDDLRRASPAGVVCGLEVFVRVEPGDGRDAELGVEPGLGVDARGRVVGLVRPVVASWSEFAADAPDDGVWVVLLERREEVPTIRERRDACSRTELNPLLDRRLETGARLRLAASPLLTADEVDDAGFDLATGRAGLAHHVAGEFLGVPLTSADDLGVPVALVGVVDGEAVWFESTVARRDATRLGGHRALAAHVARRVADVEARHRRKGGETDEAWAARLGQALALRWLPAAGRLPLGVLHARSSSLPRLEGFPDALRVELAPIPIGRAADVVRAEEGRDPIDLLSPSGEILRLLVAVDDDVYRPDLLDVPSAAERLIEDVHRMYRANAATFVAWVDVANELLAPTAALARAGLEVAPLPANDEAPGVDEIADLLPAGLAKAFERDTLPDVGLTPDDLAELGAASLRLAAPELPDALFDALDESYRATIPEDLASHERWSAARKLDAPAPSAVERAGQAVRLELLGQLLDHVDDRIEDLRDELDRTRDVTLLQRQQLDAQSLNFAALAGGVATDGSGLRLLRKMPYAKFEAKTADVEAEPEVATDTMALRAVTPFVSSRTVRFETFSPIEHVTIADVRKGTGTSQKRSLDVFSSGKSFEGRGFDPGRELGIEYSPEPLGEPAYRVESSNFGTLSHVKPEVYPAAAAESALDQIRAKLADEESGLGRVRERFEQAGDRLDVDDDDTPPRGADEPTDYEDLFERSRKLVTWIERTESAARSLERDLRRLVRDRARLRRTYDRLGREVAELRRRLKSAADRRDELDEDHEMARALVREDARRVGEAIAERARALDDARGLYFVRARRLPVERPWADPLPLRHDDPDDFVPGCGDDHGELRPELEPFVEAVLEQPIDDFVTLRSKRTQLPPWHRVQSMLAKRRARVSTTVTERFEGLTIAGTQLATGLFGLATQNRIALTAAPAVDIPRGLALSKLHERSARVLSVQDVIDGPRSGLRRSAERLRDDLEQAVACLAAGLERVGPSERLLWARAADDGRIDVSDVTRWPGIQRVEDASFDVARSLVELVDWIFGRIDADSSSSGRAALRNLVRAALLVAAYGDPADLLRGPVVTPPAVLRPGLRLRVKLNRPARIGRLLHLRDAAHRVVGRVTVDDEDEDGTTVRLTQVSAEVVDVRSFSVTALTIR